MRFPADFFANVSANIWVGLIWAGGGAAFSYMLISLIDTGMHRDLVLTADAALRFEEWLFHVPLMLGILAILGARMNGLAWAGALFLAFMANETRLFSEIIHGFLNQGGFYPDGLRHGNNPVNVQWSILLAYFLIYPLLLGQVIWKKTRHLGRVFVLVIITVTFGTTFLFHQVLINNALNMALLEARQNQSAMMRQAIARPDPQDFLADCQIFQLWCQQSALAETPVDPPADFADWVNRTATQKPDGLVIEQRPLNALQRQIIGQQAMYLHTETIQRWAIDRKIYTRIVARYKIYFAILVSAAHLAWAFGGMALLAMHRSPLRYQLRGRP